MKKVSVVVLSYNKPEYTRKCIESVLKNSIDTDFEIILVDNNSSQETQNYLDDLVGIKEIKIIRNKKNVGFGQGNNIGMKAASGDYIILLNNDTIVTPQWIKRFLYHIDKPKVGLVGPVTNNIGNEAKINISYNPVNITELYQQAKEYTDKHEKQSKDVDNIAAFCWIMKRSTYEQIGGFDERFGKAFFEDDDYCMRVKKMGYKILIAEDVFVHHFHNVSVNSLGSKEYNKLILQNKRLFEEKWNISWRPHRFRDSVYLKEINKIRLKIKELRRQLAIDDKSIFFRLKGKLSSKKNVKLVDNQIVETDKSTELEKLTRYLNRLLKLRKLLFFVPSIVALVDYLKQLSADIRSTNFRQELSEPQQTLIIFGAIPYKGRYQRPQHLVDELNKRGWRIVYIEMDRSSFASLKISKVKKDIYNVFISVTGNPNVTMQVPTEKNIREIKTFIRSLVINGKIVFKIDHPFWHFMTKDKYPVVYDCMDDHESFEAGTDEFISLEKKLAKESSVVLVSSKLLKVKMEKYEAKRVEMLRNAGDFTHFSRSAKKTLPVPIDIKGLNEKIIGYYGAIAEWFDAKIIIELAKRFPHDSIVLIGSVSHPTLIGHISQFDNVHLLGEKPYQLLPNYLQMFDICLIPFVMNDLIKATNPVKIYEYFAAGKPVVSTNLPELLQFKDELYLASDTNDFVKKVKTALEENDKNLVEKRQEIARQNTWSKRGDDLDHIITPLIQ